MYDSSQEVLDLFNRLDQDNIAYAVLRDLENSIPDKVDNTKDIDLIIYEKDKEKFQKFMKQNGFLKVRHPWNFGNNFVFLYAMDPLEFYEKGIFHLDICYQLCCRSSDHGEWLPVDQMVQNSVWQNRKKNAQYGYWQLSSEDEFVHLITRCIFDKKQVKPEYKSRLKELLAVMDEEDVRTKLNLVVFKYTDRLMEQIKADDFGHLYENYIKFIGY